MGENVDESISFLIVADSKYVIIVLMTVITRELNNEGNHGLRPLFNRKFLVPGLRKEENLEEMLRERSKLSITREATCLQVR